MTGLVRSALFFVCSVAVLAPQLAMADPCGMVPPAYTGPGDPIERVGAQKTYVFYKNGIESIVLRPAFRGKVSNFGMLIPFPTPPAIRKVADNIFSHIGKAIDPPELVVYAMRPPPPPTSIVNAAPVARRTQGSSAPRLAIHAVRVLRKEAIGMYQVAVLQAGSPMALQRWMKKNGYKYPKGMDKVVGEYVNARWSFVAVKTRVAAKSGLSPRPGMRNTKAKFPKGGYFRGAVQAMGFRFRTKKLVVPMRLSAFNKGKLRNIVYLLTDGPQRIRNINRSYVRRQLSGAALFRNVTSPLALRILGGSPKMISQYRWRSIQRRRAPEPHNGLAKALFASDLLAAQRSRLSLPHEETKKQLLRIGERLLLRGKRLDWLHRQALAQHREEAVKLALDALKKMTLTVVDGDFPRKILARENLTFQAYTMPPKKNKEWYYNAKVGIIYKKPRRSSFGKSLLYTGSPKKHPWKPQLQKHRKPTQKQARRAHKTQVAAMIRALRDPAKVNAALQGLAVLGKKAVPALWAEAVEDQPLVRRGWAIVALAAAPRHKVVDRLRQLTGGRHPMLVRTWALAGIINRTRTLAELKRWRGLFSRHSAIKRPLRKAVERLVFAQKKPNVSSMFSLLSWSHQFRTIVGSRILAFGGPALIKEMLAGKTDANRRLAASYVGALARKQPKKTISTLLHAIRFRPGATEVPWKGGALFLPSLQWTKGTGLRLMTHLIAWMVWGQRRSRRKLHRQIHNMLRSWTLSRTVGYRTPGWGKPISTSRWLILYGKAIGCAGFRRLLLRQSLLRHHDFQPAVRALRCF